MRRVTWLALALAAAALSAGCGSSSTAGTSSKAATGATGQTSSTPSESSTTSGTGSSTPTPPSASPGTSSTPAGTSAAKGALAKLLVRACKAPIQNEPALTTGEKTKLESLCAKTANGPAAARKAASEVCTEIVKRSALPGSPATPARKQALAACQTAK
jgi:hypothetical protein